MGYTLTINIADPETPESDGSTSTAGHMWYSVSDGLGNTTSYGFSPEKAGMPLCVDSCPNLPLIPFQSCH